MSVVDISALLGEKSDDPPSGGDLEYDPTFQQMEQAALGTPERQMGDSIIPAEPPAWKDVRALALEVLERSHDLRAAACLARALVRTDGYEGLADGLELISGMLDGYWDTAHPQLDPEDDLDPTLRVNVIESLANFDATLSGLRQAPLVSHPMLGRFGLRELEIASGAAPPSAGEGDAPEEAAVNAAFLDADLEALQAVKAAVERCRSAIKAIDGVLLERIGAAACPDLSPLESMLSEADRELSARLSQRGAGPAAEEAGTAAGDAAAAGPAGAPARGLSGTVRNRDDVIRGLDAICSYYEREEPSSPVPMLLRRAKRLASMDFMELVRDLAPSGVHEVETILGSAEGEE